MRNWPVPTVNSILPAPRRESVDALSHGGHAQPDLVGSHRGEEPDAAPPAMFCSDSRQDTSCAIATASMARYSNGGFAPWAFVTGQPRGKMDMPNG
jgi:hypothetical protein